jgi:LEA14-like dessication related protein
VRAVSLSVSVAASAVLVSAMLGGCSLFVPKFETPQLSVMGIEVQKADLWEQRMKVRLRVVNPNDRPIPVKGLTCALEVAGQELAHGVSGASFNVPALGEAEFDMNMTANMAGAIIKLLGKGSDSLGDEVEYRVTGKISLSEGLLRSIPFEDHGKFKLR